MTIYDGRQSFYQWDLNQRLVADFKVGDEVHFHNNQEPTALVVLTYEFGGKIVADVPNILLQQAYPITAYRYVYDGTSACTREERTFLVEERVQPSDYVYNETELYTITTAVNKVSTMSANALKATASGEFVKIDDVSPIEHTVNVKIIGENIDPTSVTLTSYGKNIVGLSEREVVDFGNFGSDTIRTFTGKSIVLGVTANNYYSRPDITEYNITDDGISFTTSGGGYGIGIDVAVRPNTTYALNSVSNANNIAISEFDSDGKFITFKVLPTTKTFTTGENTKWIIICFRSSVTGEHTDYSKIQLEVGSDVTEYERYNGTYTYTPSADGTVNIVSLYPTMTLLTDNAGVTIEAEYNQDANLVIGKLQTQINELRTIIDKLKG